MGPGPSVPSPKSAGENVIATGTKLLIEDFVFTSLTGDGNAISTLSAQPSEGIATANVRMCKMRHYMSFIQGAEYTLPHNTRTLNPVADWKSIVVSFFWPFCSLVCNCIM